VAYVIELTAMPFEVAVVADETAVVTMVEPMVICAAIHTVITGADRPALLNTRRLTALAAPVVALRKRE
jgi:hypothetical protein